MWCQIETIEIAESCKLCSWGDQCSILVHQYGCSNSSEYHKPVLQQELEHLANSDKEMFVYRSTTCKSVYLSSVSSAARQLLAGFALTPLQRSGLWENIVLNSSGRPKLYCTGTCIYRPFLSYNLIGQTICRQFFQSTIITCRKRYKFFATRMN